MYHDLHLFRAYMTVIINNVYFCRGEYGVTILLIGDIVVHDGLITLFLRKVKD